MHKPCLSYLYIRERVESVNSSRLKYEVRTELTVARLRGPQKKTEIRVAAPGPAEGRLQAPRVRPLAPNRQGALGTSAPVFV